MRDANGGFKWGFSVTIVTSQSPALFFARGGAFYKVCHAHTYRMMMMMMMVMVMIGSGS